MEGNAQRDGKVIGVVRDFYFQSLHTTLEPFVIMLENNRLPFVNIRLKNGNSPETMNFIKQIWQEINPQNPIEYQFINERLITYYDEEKKIARLVQYFSIICIVIACMGLFGLAAYTAEQKTKEMGIRKVLGASIKNIIVKLSKEFLTWVLLANVIAVPVAYMILKQWLANFAYAVSIPVFVFFISAFVTAFIALLTVFYHALKTALTNPANILKYE